MIENNNNSNPSWREVRVQQQTAKETVGTIQNISKYIREYSLRMRAIMNTINESEAIPEMADAIREGSLAVRDTVKDINKTTQVLKKNGVIIDTANAVESTLKSAEESISTVKEIGTDAGKASPNTTKAVQEGIDKVKKETSHMTEKMFSSIKGKVNAR
ncbi:MAG: hypothetical protein OEQ12_01125 [Nitrosopumilus sp.]|nr:hypothetical protein [Nitrosopumilus sp.]